MAPEGAQLKQEQVSMGSTHSQTQVIVQHTLGRKNLSMELCEQPMSCNISEAASRIHLSGLPKERPDKTRAGSTRYSRCSKFRQFSLFYILKIKGIEALSLSQMMLLLTSGHPCFYLWWAQGQAAHDPAHHVRQHHVQHSSGCLKSGDLWCPVWGQRQPQADSPVCPLPSANRLKCQSWL